MAQLYIASALEGSCFVFANLSRFASFPKVVSQEQFPAASAQSGTATHMYLLGISRTLTYSRRIQQLLAILLEKCFNVWYALLKLAKSSDLMR